MTVDVIVVGAGPAGCAAAIELAQAGHSVLLCERGELPQAKTCGDLLLPTALRALASLGVAEAVRTEGLTLTQLALQAPGERTVSLALEGVTLSRTRLHELLQAQAVAAGVTLLHAEVLGPIHCDGATVGVSLRDAAGTIREQPARLVILASGSRYPLLEAFGVGSRPEATAVGIRAYYRDLTGRPADTLHIALQRQLAPGFGWVFPLPGGIYNIGCGRLLHGLRAEQIDLQRLLDDFIHSFEPAWSIVSQDFSVGIHCGGLLRTGLVGARPSSAGLLVAGDAIGSAAPLLGAGVAGALESGRLAGQVAREALQCGNTTAVALERYDQQLEEHFRPRYRGLQRAERWLQSPRRLDLLAWQGQRKPATAAALAGIIGHGVLPRELFSLRGLLGLAS